GWTVREELPLFEVVGLRRVRGGGVHLARTTARSGQPLTLSAQVKSAHFVVPDGSTIEVTSHRADRKDSYQRIRSHAPVNPYLQIMNAKGASVTDWSMRA